MTDEHLCLCCPVLYPTDKPNHYEQAQVCQRCRDRMDADLDRLPDLTAQLPAAFPKTTRPGTNGSRIRSTPQSSEPINWSPYDLTLPADMRKRELLARAALGLDSDQIGDLSVATILDTWARDWITHDFVDNDYLPDPHVYPLCRWLADRLGEACDRHPNIDEFADEICSLARTVAAVGRTDHSKGEKIGRCPALLRDETRCGAQLRVDPYVDQIQCGRCGTRWDRRKGEWLKLASDQITAADDLRLARDAGSAA